MKRTNKIFVVVVLALVVLFGIGQFFAGSNPVGVSPTSTSTTTAPAALQTTQPAANTTQVFSYKPPEPASSTPVEQGSCWTNSIAAPFRADAWRCAVGNGISDPCFQIPQSANLMCGVNPTVPVSTSTFVLQLTKPLPKTQVPQGVAPNDWAWLIELSNGTLCTPLTGTLPALTNNDFANYACTPGPLGNNIFIVDDLNTSSSLWTATVGSLANTSSGLQTVVNTTTISISTIYQ